MMIAKKRPRDASDTPTPPGVNGIIIMTVTRSWKIIERRSRSAVGSTPRPMQMTNAITNSFTQYRAENQS